MFFYIVYKSPLWPNMRLKNRNVRVFLAGILLYIIFHSFLYSKYFENDGTLKNYRKYIYYVLTVDILITFVSIATSYLMKKRHKKRKYIKWNRELPDIGLLQYNYQNPREVYPYQVNNIEQFTPIRPQPQPQPHPQPQPQQESSSTPDKKINIPI